MKEEQILENISRIFCLGKISFGLLYILGHYSHKNMLFYTGFMLYTNKIFTLRVRFKNTLLILKEIKCF